ncbi:MAG: hypothetical protein HY521_14980 [Proteobacteria bacterium]|nr:hypothetical protein [Pseudomonadota bacterium]
MKLAIGGRSIDLALAFPLTIGDWKALEAQGVLAAGGGAAKGGAAETAALLLHLARKVDPEVGEEEIDSLALGILPEVAAFVAQRLRGEAIDRPTSTRSTSSPGPTAGAPATSIA